MRLKALVLLGLTSTWLMAADFKAVSAWPRVVYVDGKQIVNPNAETCVKAGYRLLGEEPDVPEGKRVVKKEVIQDPNDPTRAKIVLTCIDIPEPSKPETITNVSADKVRFSFTTNGLFRCIQWIDAPSTNAVK